MLKKIIIAIFVTSTFVVYSLHQRSDGNAAVINVTKNNSDSGINTHTVSQSPTTVQPASTGTSTGQFKDGTYTGSEADAFYGYIKIQAIVSGGRLSEVTFLEYPNDRGTSVQINDYAMPKLKQQAIAAQSANVNGVSGATDTSQAFIQSLGDALSQAKA